jgi:hypothetical protein
VSVVPVTVGVKACVLPKSREAAAGVTVTLMVAGGGWTAGELVTALPQPTADALAMRSARAGAARKLGSGSLLGWVPVFCERGRMTRRNAGEGPGKRELRVYGRTLCRNKGGGKVSCSKWECYVRRLLMSLDVLRRMQADDGIRVAPVSELPHKRCVPFMNCHGSGKFGFKPGIGVKGFVTANRGMYHSV